ncbi:MAG: DegV family protein [Firmicutes bacterium]|uniref:DegV family protein n=1 Tax=Candidatus Onthovivens merdipullorum TaxID=2840889 RepID=A0A9D9DHK7_9BACL|nr:DegV family protein [Candidatus Onthovivens merdipullorum]
MKFKIVVDSSSNLKSDYLVDKKDIGFSVAPLTIRLKDEEFIDDDKLDVSDMLKKINSSSEVGHSSCPSPNDFLKYFNEDESGYTFVATITSKLSGSYNSALVAKESSVDPSKVLVIDSLGTAGTIVLIVDKLVELIEKNLSFAEISKKILRFRDSLNLLFALDKFDNLVKNGRINKIVAFIANLASIKPLCYADNGDIKIKEKIRTFKGVLKRIVYNIGKMCEDTKNRVCIISHTNNLVSASLLKKEIEQSYEFKEVRIMDNRGLCAFYSLDGALIVTF